MRAAIIRNAMTRKQNPFRPTRRNSGYIELNMAAPNNVQIVSKVATAAKSAPIEEEM